MQIFYLPGWTDNLFIHVNQKGKPRGSSDHSCLFSIKKDHVMYGSKGILNPACVTGTHSMWGWPQRVFGSFTWCQMQWREPSWVSIVKLAHVTPLLHRPHKLLLDTMQGAGVIFQAFRGLGPGYLWGHLPPAASPHPVKSSRICSGSNLLSAGRARGNLFYCSAWRLGIRSAPSLLAFHTALKAWLCARVGALAAWWSPSALLKAALMFCHFFYGCWMSSVFCIF